MTKVSDGHTNESDDNDDDDDPDDDDDNDDKLLPLRSAQFTSTWVAPGPKRP